MIDLRLGDSLKVMKTMPDNSVDLVITSPPYNIGMKYDELDSDSKSNEDYLLFTKEYLTGCYRLLKDDGRFCLNIGYKVSTVKDGGIDYVDLLNLIKSIGYTVRETIVWVKSRQKEDPQSFCGANTAWGSWMSASNPICRARMEFIFVLNKNKYKKEGKGRTTITKQEFMDYASNVWYFPAETDRTHKAPFPVELPKRCIKFYTFENDTVLDPFMGLAATGVACKELGRNFIGIEILPKYFKIAKRRIGGTPANNPPKDLIKVKDEDQN